jgi:hypothetical protein
MPLTEHNRSPLQVKKILAAGSSGIGSEMYFSQSVSSSPQTFWGWHDRQLTDGTVIWMTPFGQTHVTIPGSALLFPSLCTPTGDVPTLDLADAERRGDRMAMMPLRATTRAQNRSQCINAERARNCRDRQARREVCIGAQDIEYAPTDPDPPPF